MPSKTVALGLVAMVLLAGCSMLGGGGGGPGAVGEPPDRHEFVFASDTNGHPFEATVTVTRDGETLLSKHVESDGNGAFANLSAVGSSGPYEVTVNTTLPAAGGGNMSEHATVPGGLGNATAIDVGYQGISLETVPLPRRDASGVLGYRKSGPNTDATVRVWYRGERVYAETFTAVDKRSLQELTGLEETGVYRVAVHSGGTWLNKSVVVTDPDARISFHLTYQNRPDWIRVRVPFADRED